jgi:hypothetical protein
MKLKKQKQNGNKEQRNWKTKIKTGQKNETKLQTKIKGETKTKELKTKMQN